MLLLGSGLFTNLANAASYEVINTDSSGAGSLRAAVTSANSDNVDSAITFQAAAFASLQTILLGGTELALANNGKLSITGPAARVEISGNAVSRVFAVAAGADVTLTGLDIIRGKSAAGAGINNAGTLTVNNCSIRLNQSSDFGGGIYNTGNLTVNSSTLSSNGATSNGGGIYNTGTVTLNSSTLSGNSATSNGGGIYNTTSGLTIENCLLRNNTAIDGGGIYNVLNGAPTVTNSTFYNNVADSSGGGIYTHGALSLTNCTFAVNFASNGFGGAIFTDSPSNVNLTNCLTAQNAAISGNNIQGSFNDNGGNIQASTVQQAGLNSTGLADNGGPTQTVALVAKGTAVNAGVNAAASGLTYDQRGPGYPRLVGGNVDSGAYESSFALVLENNSGLTLGLGASATITEAMLKTTDVNNDPLTYTLTSGPSHGTVKLSGNPTGSFTQADIAAGHVSYTQDGSFVGSDSFDFSVSDGKGGVVTGTFAITITEAPSLVVTTTADNLTTDGQISLREAIAFANGNADQSTITFNIPPILQTGGVWIINTGSKLTISTNTIITGPGANLLTIRESDSNKSFALFEVNSDLGLSGVTLSNGSYGLANPGSATITLANCILSGNTVGLYSQSMATLTGCTLSGNTNEGFINNGTATLTNCTISGNSINFVNNSGATATLTNCTLSDSTSSHGFNNNGTATLTGCTLSGNHDIGFLNLNTATLTNCTLSGNANIGFLNNGGTTGTLTNCTISGNNIGLLNSAAPVVKNSLIVGNGTDLVAGGLAAGSSNNITSGTAAAAGLDPAGLKNNGGPTKTIALVTGGNAINAGDNSLIPAGITTDQRGSGYPRILGGTVDIGAYEFGSGSLSINDISVTESNGGSTQAVFTVTLSVPSTKTVSVVAKTVAGGSPTATAGTDYNTLAPTTITFTPGQTTKTVNVTVLGDIIDESDEKFAVSLYGAANATISDSTGIGTIVDNDNPPLISVSAPNVTEGTTGGTATMTFTIKLSAASARNISVQYQTAVASTFPATSGTDYTAVPLTTVIFAAGETTKTVNVTVKGDVLDEENERIKLNLTNPVNATLGTTSEGIIVDDDATPSLSINDLSINEGQSGTKLMLFTVTLSAASGRTVTVNAATGNGGTPAATAGSDYVALASTPLTFTPGQTIKQVAVTINGDTAVEVNEKLAVIISGAVNATIADNSGIGTILNDDAAPAPANNSSGDEDSK